MSRNRRPVSRNRRPTAPEPTSSRDAVTAALSADLARLAGHLPAIFGSGDPEAIHEVRVALRRARSELRSFAPLFDRRAKSARRELGRLARLLGPARDLDVLGERFLAHAEGLTDEPVELVFARLAAEREAALGRLVSELRSEASAAACARLAEMAASPPLRRRAEGPAGETLVPLVRRRWRELELASGGLGPAPGDAELHVVRILVKRARYASEVCVDFGPPHLRRLAKRLKRLQDSLGELSDGARAVDWLSATRTSRWPLLPGALDPLVAVEALLAREHGAMAVARAAWWADLDDAVEAARALNWTKEAAGGPRAENGARPFGPLV